MNGEILKSHEWIGKCGFCKGKFSKDVMFNHLKLCEQRKITPTKPSYRRKSKRKDQSIFHLIVEGSYKPEYWMHLNVPSDVKLEDLDDFLREIWVECCGHLSAFNINNVRYEKDTAAVDDMWSTIFGKRARPRSMYIRTGIILHSGLEFSYEYDFGTTTHLTLKVLSEREESTKYRSIKMLARNEPPLIICNVCGKPAKKVCSQCLYENKGWLCDQCAHEHKCGEDMLLPVVNSPRVGMCAYTGYAPSLR